jgi:hypothetical protein
MIRKFSPLSQLYESPPAISLPKSGGALRSIDKNFTNAAPAHSTSHYRFSKARSGLKPKCEPVSRMRGND